MFDTGAFIVLKHFYPDTFKLLWAKVEKLVAEKSIVSTQEIFRELGKYNDSDFIQTWAKSHKDVFTTPLNAELAFVGEIFAVPHFQYLIGSKQLLNGTPVADPFVIAAAKTRKGTVVTQEQEKPNAAKMPNVCDHFQIPCINLQKFMAQQGWSF